MTISPLSFRGGTTGSPARVDAGLAVLRLILGIVFVAHGAQKLFVFGFDGVVGAFSQMGIPIPVIAGPVVALAEFFGGLALIAGVVTRAVAAGLALVMLGAIVMVHLPSGFYAPAGIEFPLTLLGGLVAVVLMGPGRWAIGGGR